ncbi:MAG: ABC transporter substrate-binding protein [Actinomycetota bacterium]
MGRLLLLFLTLTFFASACRGQEARPMPDRTADDDGAFPVTVKAANGEVTIDAPPERIVSMSATSTEMLFAIEAGGQVVAVDDNSNYPPQAPMTDISAYEPNVEAVAGFDPDLVVVSDDINDLVKSLAALDIPVMVHPAAETLDATYSQIEQLGAATGHVAESADLVASMTSEIDELTESVPDFQQAPTYYHELDQTYFSVTSRTFIGEIYGLVGLENIADTAEEGNPYPQLSAEFIIDADPDLIFLADTKCCGINAEKVAARPGWDQISAVKTGAVVELDDDIASRWGPRVVDLLRVVVERVSELQPVGG